MALQVTLFPNSGFCIGITTHHAVLDGKSSTMFMKAWAYLCRTTQESPFLLTELEPFLDRSVIRDPNGLDIKYLNEWKWIAELVDSSPTKERSLKILPNTPPHNKLVLATFELNRGAIEKLNKRVLSLWDKVDKVETATTKPPNLSTFVLASAFVFTCAGKAIIRIGTNNTDIAFGFSADCRSRLEPQVHSNYLGNCVFPCMISTEAGDFAEEDGVVIMAKRIHSTIRRLEKGVLDEADTLFARWQSMANKGTRGIGIGGFTRFGVYKTDFGWGRPVKVEIATMDINGLITMAEGRDGNDGVELGLHLYKNELELFSCLFRDGIEGLQLLEFKK